MITKQNITHLGPVTTFDGFEYVAKLALALSFRSELPNSERTSKYIKETLELQIFKICYQDVYVFLSELSVQLKKTSTIENMFEVDKIIKQIEDFQKKLIP